METPPKDGAPETIDMAVQVTKFDVAHYRREDMPLKFNQANNHEIMVWDTSDGHIFPSFNPSV